MGFFRFLLFLTVYAFINSANADHRNILQISEDYDQNFFWGQQIGEEPLVYSAFSIADFDDKLNKLDKNIDRLLKIQVDHADDQLWHDLYNFSKEELFILRSCQPGVWDYTEAFQIISFFNNLIHRLEGQGTSVNDTFYLERSINNLAHLLKIYNEKIRVSIDKQLLPSSNNFIVSMEVPEQIGLDRDSFHDFLFQYESRLCSNCAINTEFYLKQYDAVLKPLIDEFFTGLDEVRFQSTQQDLIVPITIKKECYTAVMTSAGSETYRPEQILEIGQRELARAEAMMFDIISSQSQAFDLSQFTESAKLTTLNGCVQTLIDAEEQYFENPEEYMQFSQKWIDKAMAIVPQVTSLKVNPPLLEDMNYEIFNSPGAFYFPEPPGTVQVNSLAQYPKFHIPNLMIHEAAPGHHLERQLALSLSPKMPFYEYHRFSDFVEGWAFYMEEYADEIGFYETDLQRLGYLDEKRIRALRLILPYLFYFDEWDEQEIREYARQHMRPPEFRFESEIGRIKHWRGQVIGYVIGKENIMSMRQQARQVLGQQYSDIKFHDFLLGHGNINMVTLKTLFKGWLNQDATSTN